jgi:hypothetical protein
MPVFFLGALRVTTVDVVASNGEKIIIPIRLPDEKAIATVEQIERLIGQKTRR